MNQGTKWVLLMKKKPKSKSLASVPLTPALSVEHSYVLYTWPFCRKRLLKALYIFGDWTMYSTQYTAKFISLAMVQYLDKFCAAGNCTLLSC
jgi:hypothetical protein